MKVPAKCWLYQEELCTMNVRDLYLEDELSRRPIMFKELLNGEQTLLERIMIDKMDLP
jgi:hypothetical protein